MSEARRSAVPQHVVPWQNGRVVRWLAATDHKQVGLLTIALSGAFLVLTVALSLVVRAQLTVASNDAISHKLFAELITMNGTTLLYLAVLPALLGLGTYLVPLLIGARAMALPRLTALSFWLYAFAGVILTATWVSSDGPPKATFESLLPLANGQFSPGKTQTVLGLAMILLAASWLAWAVNVLATIAACRAEGMTWARLPVFAWGAAVTALTLIVTTPVLGVANAFLVLDREAGTHILTGSSGARAYEHLYWFFARPALGVMTVLAIGIVSEVVAVMARRPLAGRPVVVASLGGIAVLSMLSYGTSLSATHQSGAAQDVFMVAALLLAAVTLVPVGAWIVTIAGGSLRRSAATAFAVGAIVTLTVAALASVFLASLPISLQLSGTAYDTAQLDYLVLGAVLLAAFAGLFYWWPKLTGRVLDERLGILQYLLLFVGLNTALIPQFMLGVLGMPADTFTYANHDWAGYQQHSTVGAAIFAAGILLFIVNVTRTTISGKRVGHDPWKGDTLEWYAASPPVATNFDGLPAITSERPVRDVRLRLESRG